MGDKKKLWWVFLFAAIVIGYLVYWNVSTYNNSRITLNLSGEDTPVSCRFQIGQAREQVVDEIENANVNYYDYEQDKYNRDCIVVEGKREQYLLANEARAAQKLAFALPSEAGQEGKYPAACSGTSRPKGAGGGACPAV